MRFLDVDTRDDGLYEALFDKKKTIVKRMNRRERRPGGQAPGLCSQVQDFWMRARETMTLKKCCLTGRKRARGSGGGVFMFVLGRGRMGFTDLGTCFQLATQSLFEQTRLKTLSALSISPPYVGAVGIAGSLTCPYCSGPHRRNSPATRST